MKRTHTTAAINFAVRVAALALQHAEHVQSNEARAYGLLSRGMLDAMVDMRARHKSIATGDGTAWCVVFPDRSTYVADSGPVRTYIKSMAAKAYHVQERRPHRQQHRAAA
jgi:hypothetical protein